MPTYNDLTLEIPAGWEDATVVTLIGQTPEPTTPLHVAPPKRQPPSIVVKELTPNAWDGNLEAFVAAQDDLIKRSLLDPDMTQPISTDRNAVTREWCFGPNDDRVRQIQHYVVQSNRLFLVCGTASDDLNFDGVRKSVRRVAESIR